MNRLAITSAALLLGGSLAAAGTLRAQAQRNQVNQNPAEQNWAQQSQYNYANSPDIIVMQGGKTSDQFGSLAFKTPQDMSQDAVVVDGARVGRVGNISQLQLLPGTHELILYAPNGQAVYQHRVGIQAGEVTDVIPTEAEEAANQAAQDQAVPPQYQSSAAVAGNTAEPSSRLLPPAPANAGTLKLDTPSAMRHDAVFVNGAYAGIVNTIKDVRLAPGTYNIALCTPNGYTEYEGSVNISANHTTGIGSDVNLPALQEAGD